jgi:hypothetical protein
MLRKPITGIAVCCARTASGQEAAAPPSTAMNSRRLMGFYKTEHSMAGRRLGRLSVQRRHLSEPETYEGGALVIESTAGEQEF